MLHEKDDEPTVPLPVLVVRYVSCLRRERPKSPTCMVNK